MSHYGTSIFMVFIIMDIHGNHYHGIHYHGIHYRGIHGYSCIHYRGIHGIHYRGYSFHGIHYHRYLWYYTGIIMVFM